MPTPRCGRRPALSATAAVRRQDCGAQRISGDIPILLLRIDAIEDIAIARQLLQAHEYWQMKGLAADLVILNERAASYVQDLQNALEALVRMSQSRPQPDAHSVRGSVFVLRADLISEQTRTLLSAVARVVLVARRGDLADQLDRVRKPAAAPPPRPKRAPKTEAIGERLRRRTISNSSMAWEASARRAANT